ncbi:putative fad binding domain protein [Neofusicoccum parvum UCRNP2]|uniref:Putative fad binding domain protein n=1 Tax=Botryosphaeria parva (strain UCR-NP2) TaxID=1287680 RepID=R1G6P0_BOTPV|nr:putative fad binding domain protein [Neofusicoccum parvum UCRNP2]
MFSISAMNGEIPAGIACSYYKDNRSLVVLTGANNRVYWFYSKAYLSHLYGPDIPRYTDPDCNRFTEEHWNNTHPGVAFSDLCKTRVRAVLTPFHSHVFKKQHYVGFLGMVGIMLNYQNAILQAPPCLH